MAEGVNVDELETLFREAYSKGDTETIQMVQNELSKLEPTKAPQARRATVDPLAGFRKGGPGILPNMPPTPPGMGLIPSLLSSRRLEPRSYEERSEPESARLDPAAGVAGVGRGFQNLLKGGKQIGGRMAAGVGRLMEDQNILPEGYSDEQNELYQDEIRQRREREDVPYGRLKRGLEGSMELAEIVGETAPFLNVPVPRLAAPFASGGLVRTPINVTARGAPEAIAGGTEASIPYAGSEEERAGRGQEGAAGAYLGSRLTNFFAKRANARRKIMDEENLQEMHDLGEDYGIPINQGYMEEQTRIAGDVAESRTSAASDLSLGSDVASDLATEFNAKSVSMDRQYDELFDTLDKSEGVPLKRGPGGQILPRGMVDLKPVRTNVDNMIEKEMAFGSQTDPSVLKEYQRWAELPDKVDMSDLHRFRKGLRERVPKNNTYAQGKYAELDAFISEELARHADEVQPGLGKMLRNMDSWYTEEMPKLLSNPALRNVFDDYPSPDRLLNHMLGAPDASRREMIDMMSGFGKNALKEAMWNRAYKSGVQGRSFNPLQYAKFIEKHLDTAANIMPLEEQRAFQGMGKVMRHISAEGKATNATLLKLFRGFPFFYRAVADRVRQSNTLYMLANVPPDIRPGSPEMERIYRGIIRGVSIQQEPLDSAVDTAEGLAAEIPNRF